MPSSPKTEKICIGFCVFFLILGEVSRILLYANGQDLWLEEALLWEAFKPLIGGLSISELALRFLPLLAGIATLLFAYIFAKREFGVRFACIFLFLLVSSDSLLFYSVNFSLYGIEALLIVLCLCAWSYSRKKERDLISLILFASIFCIICNYNKNNDGYWFNIWASAGPIHGLVIFIVWFKDFFVQMLGRHFIDFHYFVFGPFVWINALFFVLPFIFGSIFLYREKKGLLISVFIPVFILALLYLFKVMPLGMPYSDFMRSMRNWSQMQVTGSKYLVFIMPLIFIPVAFCIHKVLLKVGTGTLIAVLSIFAFLALSSNSIRMHKGLGSPQSMEILQLIDENATAKSLVYVDSVSRPVFEYYMSKSPLKDNPNLNYFYVKKNGYMYLNDDIFIGKYYGYAEELFDVMKNFRTENGFFFFVFGDSYSVRESHELIGYIQKNYAGKSKGFQSKYAGAAWVRF
jgi:hypothetical protein